MIELFDVLGANPGTTRLRLVDAVVCPHCGTTLMRGQMETADTPPARLPRILCVDCGADAGADR